VGRSYLNKEEKNIVLTLSSFISFLGNQTTNWKKLKRPANQLKYAKTAKTFSEKVLGFLLEGLDPLEAERIRVGTNSVEVIVKYTDNAIRAYKNMEKLDSVTPIETDHLLYIAAQAIEVCKGCDYNAEAVKKCPLRFVLIKYDIPVLDEDAVETCPYNDQQFTNLTK